MRNPWSGLRRSSSGRGSPPPGRRRWQALLIPAMGVAVICQLSLTGMAGAATATTTAQRPLVNWDVASVKWDHLTARARHEWTRLAGR